MLVAPSAVAQPPASTAPLDHDSPLVKQASQYNDKPADVAGLVDSATESDEEADTEHPRQVLCAGSAMPEHPSQGPTAACCNYNGVDIHYELPKCPTNMSQYEYDRLKNLARNKAVQEYLTGNALDACK